jgi:hypothetical protein
LKVLNFLEGLDEVRAARGHLISELLLGLAKEGHDWENTIF